MSRNEKERLRDIKDAVAAIRQHLEQAGETSAAKEDPLLHDALLFQFVVIGEAVKNLTPETRESAPEIPWTDIAGLRDLIAHKYFRIDRQPRHSSRRGNDHGGSTEVLRVMFGYERWPWSRRWARS